VPPPPPTRCSRKSEGWADDNNGLIEL